MPLLAPSTGTNGLTESANKNSVPLSVVLAACFFSPSWICNRSFRCQPHCSDKSSRNLFSTHASTQTYTDTMPSITVPNLQTTSVSSAFLPQNFPAPETCSGGGLGCFEVSESIPTWNDVFCQFQIKKIRSQQHISYNLYPSHRNTRQPNPFLRPTVVTDNIRLPQEDTVTSS